MSALARLPAGMALLFRHVIFLKVLHQCQRHLAQCKRTALKINAVLLPPTAVFPSLPLLHHPNYRLALLKVGLAMRACNGSTGRHIVFGAQITAILSRIKRLFGGYRYFKNSCGRHLMYYLCIPDKRSNSRYRYNFAAYRCAHRIL